MTCWAPNEAIKQGNFLRLDDRRQSRCQEKETLLIAVVFIQGHTVEKKSQ
jgi:hypothetical protein